jgi:hypothetical protein
MNLHIGRSGLAGRRDILLAHVLPAPLHGGRDREQRGELRRDRSAGRIGADLIDQRHPFRQLGGGERGVRIPAETAAIERGNVRADQLPLAAAQGVRAA